MSTQMQGWGMVCIAGLLSGLGIRWGWGLEPVWQLSWFAPILLLWLAMRSDLRKTLFAVFLAGIVGYGGLFPYYRKILPLPWTFIVVLGQILFLCAAIGFVHRQRRNLSKAWHPWLFPLALTSLELLVRVASGNGDGMSIAFSQGDQPVVLQIAAATGLLGITFLLALLPGWLAALLSGGPRKPVVLLAPPVVLALVLFSGHWRLTHTPLQQIIPVSLIAVDEANPRARDAESRAHTLRAYAAAVAILPAQTLVILPEKIVNIAERDLPALDKQYEDMARLHNGPILVGIAVRKADGGSNQARLYQPSQPYLVYEKEHLVPGLESAFRPGTDTLTTSIYGASVGVAICRDLFFDSPTFQYGRLGAQVLAVPAWDFPPDGWFRSRIAVIRGVENGMAVARSARQGMLTLSDRYGRVIAERSSDTHGGPAVLTNRLQVESAHPTLYLRGGWLFPWICFALCLILIVRNIHRRTRGIR